ncbi:GTP cyclohydrolase II-domain-containing protein [Cryomyces antarcticus]
MPEFAAHASASSAPVSSPRPQYPSHAIPDFELSSEHDHDGSETLPPTIISPAFTPPATPGTGTPALERDAKSIPVDPQSQEGPPPRLLETLPEVFCEARARIPPTIAKIETMFLHVYRNNLDNKEHLAIVFGPDIRSESLNAPRPGDTEHQRMIRGAYEGRLYPGRTTSKLSRVEQIQQESGVGRNPESHSKAPLVRIHSECYTGETVWSARCDCGEQLEEAARLMSLPQNMATGGVIVYLRQEGRGIGLGEKLKAYNLQDLGNDTVEANLLLRHPADARSYGLATAMLLDLGLGGERGIRLLTNNPDKIRAVEGPNREVVVKERVAMVPLAWQTGGKRGVQGEDVEKYLSTKIMAMGHMLSSR